MTAFLILCTIVCGSASAASSFWSDYQIIMWQPQSDLQYAALRHLGVTAGQVQLDDRDQPARLPIHSIEPLLRNHLRWYVENIATDFYSAYHRWFPGKPVNWRFEAVKTLYDGNPLNPAALIRDPSFSDPKWVSMIRTRLNSVVKAQRAYRPLYYSLGDETGIGDLSIYWDFDFSRYSLDGFQRWLKEQYGTLTALNEEWGSVFAHWSDVIPMTAQQAMARGDENFAPWADFRAWMDVAFARALRLGRDAVHAADPGAMAAIEGGQVPGWGGYDYSQLSRAVDVMELYDGGDNLEIVRSLNPKLVILTTLSASDPQSTYQIWRELLRGSRGTILWDPNNELVDPNGVPGAAARTMASTFVEIRSALGALLINSPRNQDRTAILYSPPSMRTQWMLDWKPRGDAWSRRPVSASYEDASAVRDSMVGYSRLFEHLGVNPSFLTAEMIQRGELRRNRYKVLVLPHAISLSSAEAIEIRKFAERGGVLIADAPPGLFDEHSRRLPLALLADLFDKAQDAAASFVQKTENVFYLTPNAPGCSAHMVGENCKERLAQLARILGKNSVAPTVSITDLDGKLVPDCVIYIFRNRSARIIAIQRDARTTSYPVAQGDMERVILTLSRPAYVHNLRTTQSLGRITQLDVALDPIVPTILSASAVTPRMRH